MPDRRFDRRSGSHYVLMMAAANASARGQRAAIFASPLHELSGFLLTVDCLGPDCRRQRSFAIAELANFCGRDRTVGQVLRRMRCSGACGGPGPPHGWRPVRSSTPASGRAACRCSVRRRGSSGSATANAMVRCHRPQRAADPSDHQRPRGGCAMHASNSVGQYQGTSRCQRHCRTARRPWWLQTVDVAMRTNHHAGTY
jgi:hypothetical protein